MFCSSTICFRVQPYCSRRHLPHDIYHNHARRQTFSLGQRAGHVAQVLAMEGLLVDAWTITGEGGQLGGRAMNIRQYVPLEYRYNFQSNELWPLDSPLLARANS